MEQDPMARALNATEAIIAELRDRSGLSDAWDQIDEETQIEITFAWASIIADAIRTAIEAA